MKKRYTNHHTKLNFLQPIRRNAFKNILLLVFFFLILGAGNKLYADVTITSSPVAAGDINQGTNNNVIYIAQMDVTTTAVTVNNIQFTLSGSFDNNDLNTVLVYFNGSSPVFAGSNFLGSAVATFAAPHTFSINISRSMAAGSTGYFLIVVNADNDGTDNNTVKINGATNPVLFGFSTAPVVTNSQTDAAGVQTIQAADVTLTSNAVAVADINQGTNNNVVYIAQMSVTTEPVVVNNIQFNLGGTYDANDIATALVYFNGTSPVFAGSNFLGSAVATFAAPHTFSINLSRSMAVGSTGYFIIVVNVNDDATDNNTIKINGATNPVVFGFSTSPNITNSQTDAAGAQTIQAADLTLTSSTVAAADINQGTNNNLIYVAQMSVSTEPVVVNNIQFNLGGTYDANDIATVLVYFNGTSPVFAGSNFLGSAVATFASPHNFSINLSRNMAVGSTGYFIIVVNVNDDATDNNTIKINGATNPVVFGFSTSPNVTNSQTDATGVQTIQAADITLTSATVAAADINQGTNSNLIYVTQMSVATEPVVVNNIQFTLGGAYDANDIATVLVYFNGTSPVFAGSNFLGSAVATFASPHTFSINLSRSMAVGSTGYFIIVVNVNDDATDNNTIKINGVTNPAVFGFSTSPNVTNSQTDAAGIQTIQAADIAVSTSPVATSDFAAGSNNNVVYIAQMSVATEPVTVNNIQFTLTGIHDNNDLTNVLVYFNGASPLFAGSSFLGSAVSNFSSPHTYSINVSRSIAPGSIGYFIIVTNVSATATTGNTVSINGSTNPVVFGFTTAPNITNTQTDNGGLHTLPVIFISLSAQQIQNGVAVDWKTGSEINIEKYVIERAPDAQNFISVGEMMATGSGTTTATYHFFDKAPLPGRSFYRVRAVNNNGRFDFSPVVTTNTGKGAEGIAVYPNPVIKNGLLSIQLQNLNRDTYHLEIYNSAGQKLLSKIIEHSNGNSVHQVQLPKIAAGNYLIEISSSDKRFIKPFITE